MAAGVAVVAAFTGRNAHPAAGHAGAARPRPELTRRHRPATHGGTQPGEAVMARIERIEIGHYRIPLPEVLSDSTHGAMAEFELVTVVVTDADGAGGLGYTYTVGRGGAAIRALLEHDLVPLASGEDADRIEHVWKKLFWGVHWVGRGGVASFAIAAIDTALHDLRARRAGLPLWRMLGGHDPIVRCYAGGIDLELPLDRLLAQTGASLERGFRAIKMKVGRAALAEDVARVAAMRDRLGEGFPLMADANMRWRADEAVRAARAFEPYGLVWLEEPVVPEDVAGHVRVAREGGVPLAAGENLHGTAEFEALIAAGGVQFPEPDLATLGGVTPWLKVAHRAELAGLPVTSHGVHDLHVHLLAAVPNASFLEIHGFGLERFIAEPLAVKEGNVRAPERPGHGITLDLVALGQHRV
jgi:L-alanine-DL-glutamate epimerase-like enolase superfamily enzyme